MRRDLLHRAFEDGHRRPQEFVDGRTDHDDELTSALDHRRVSAQIEASGGKKFAQELIGTCFPEGHVPVADPLERGLVGVVDADAETGPRKGQTQRQTDMAAPAENSDVQVRRLTHASGLYQRTSGLCAREAASSGLRAPRAIVETQPEPDADS